VSTIFYPLEGCLANAAERRTALAASEIKLFQDTLPAPSPSTPLTDYDTNEADFSGYAAEAVATWSAPIFAPGTGYMISSTLVQFDFDSGMGSVANNISGCYLVDAGGDLRQVVIFTDPVPISTDGQGVQFYLTQLFPTGEVVV